MPAIPLITHARLLERVSYDPLTGIFTCRKTERGIRAKVGEPVGYCDGNGYCNLGIDRRTYLLHRLAWLYVHRQWPENHIDHIDRDPGNNRIANLREATNGENFQNIVTARKNSRHGFLGTYLHKPSGRWQALIYVNKKKHSLGYHDTPEDAHAAYVEAKRRLHPFGRL